MESPNPEVVSPNRLLTVLYDVTERPLKLYGVLPLCQNKPLVLKKDQLALGPIVLASINYKYTSTLPIGRE